MKRLAWLVVVCLGCLLAPVQSGEQKAIKRNDRAAIFAGDKTPTAVRTKRDDLLGERPATRWFAVPLA